MEKSIEFLQDMFPIDSQIIYDTFISKDQNIDETISCLINICQVETKYPPTYEEAMLNPYQSSLTATSETNSKRMDSRRNLGKKDWKPPLLGKLPDDFLRVSNEISTSSVSMGSICKSCATLKSKNEKYDTMTSPQIGASHSSFTASEIENIDTIIRKRMEDNVSQTRYATMRGEPNVDSIQYLDDERLALMLQNQEFLKIIQSDAEFQLALKEDHKAACSRKDTDVFDDIWKEKEDNVHFDSIDMDLDYGYEQSDIVDPDEPCPSHSISTANANGLPLFKSLGKASRNRINSLAAKFLSLRRRKSSKPYNHIGVNVEKENDSNPYRWETESTQQLITSDFDNDSWSEFDHSYPESLSSNFQRKDSKSTLI